MNSDQLASEMLANLDLQIFSKKGKYSYLKLSPSTERLARNWKLCVH